MAILETHLDELDAVMREKALAAFESLAQAQRGEPEMLGGGPINANPALRNAMGIYVTLTEHVGDITNRIARRDHVRMLYGIDMTEPKVRMALRALRHRYGCEREINEQLASNRLFHLQQTGEDIPMEQWLSDFDKACRRYERAHAKLTVYNRAQHLAKEAAVAIGRRDYEAATTFLTGLETMMADDDLWAKQAGTVYVDGDRIVPYREVMGDGLNNPMRKFINIAESVPVKEGIVSKLGAAVFDGMADRIISKIKNDRYWPAIEGLRADLIEQARDIPTLRAIDILRAATGFAAPLSHGAENETAFYNDIRKLRALIMGALRNQNRVEEWANAATARMVLRALKEMPRPMPQPTVKRGPWG